VTRRASELGVLAVAVVGLALSAWLPKEPGGRFGAGLGVALAVGSSAVALLLKRWGLARTLNATMVVIGAVFFMRLVLVVAGLLVVRARSGGSLVAYVVGFFAAYLVVQWIEIGDALAEDGRRDRGEK
jgi:hypothetical protein